MKRLSILGSKVKIGATLSMKSPLLAVVAIEKVFDGIPGRLHGLQKTK